MSDIRPRRLAAASLGVAFFLIPLYPAFITLTRAPVPGISLVPKAVAIALVAFVAALVVLWVVLLQRAPHEPLPTVLPVAAFAGAAAVAALLGFDPLAGALFVAILAGGVIWHAAILRFARDRDVLATIFGAYLLSGALASLAAIVMVLAKLPPGLYTFEHGRATGTFIVPGELAGYLIIYVPVAFALAREQLGLRALAFAGFVLGSVAFVLTFSRAGWIGMAAAVAVFVLVRRERNATRYAVAIIGVAAVAVLLVFNAHHDPSENFTRLSIWDAALQAVVRFPLTGVGPFEFAHIYPLVRVPGGEPAAYHAHGVVLSIATETGLIGVVALLFGWWRFVTELRARLRADAGFGRIAVAIAAGLAGTWVQGLIDTITVVIFGLWLPFMALALVCAGEPRARTLSFAGTRGGRMPRTALIASITALAVVCALVQTASDALYANAGSPYSLPAHLPPSYGTRAYETIERVAPVPFVETVLTDDALRRDDLQSATRHARRLPTGPLRSDRLARIAAAQGRTSDAIALFLDAADDEALQPLRSALVRQGRIRDAYDLESHLTDRLAAAGRRPNALAESWWRRAKLARRLGRPQEAAADYARASDLAPLNTKYLLDAGTLALQRHDPTTATRLFSRAGELDPQDADAVAGQGLAALEQRDRQSARELSSRADSINPAATLERRLRRALTVPAP